MRDLSSFLLDRSAAALIIFIWFAVMAGIAGAAPRLRAMAGAAGAVILLLPKIGGRSLFDWLVAAVDRPSAPGLLLLGVFAVAAVRGRDPASSAEFRFGSALLAAAGVMLYPGAIGFFDYDTYVLGYAGYALPLAVAAALAAAIYKRYLLVAAALNIAIIAFLCDAGRSLNLWDYLIDPASWLFALGSWLAIAAQSLLRRRSAPLAATG